MATDDIQLTARINIRLTEKEVIELRRAATAGGVSLSDYARSRLIGRTVVAATDVGTRAELSRIGGLIKKFAVDVADRQKCNAAINELIAAAKRIGAP
jgi:hypothetical protein